MTGLPSFRLVPGLLASAALLVACGGGEVDDPKAADAGGDIPTAHVLKNGGDCSGSCTGGGGTPVVGVNPLPTRAPAPGVLVRESFGPGPAGVRPKGGKGDLRSTFIGTTLGGFWVEWPGQKANAWITSASEATWKFTAASNGGPNPNLQEMASPLEVGTVFGQVFSDVSDGATGGLPTALLPVTWPAAPWSVSIEGLLWSNLPTRYLALGLTNSAATLGNLVTASQVTLLLRPSDDGLALVWELWRGGAARTLLASGPVEDQTFNQLRLSYDPQAQRLAVHVNGAPGGSFPLSLGSPRYAAFEGHGMVDNFVVRQLPAGAL